MKHWIKVVAVAVAVLVVGLPAFAAVPTTLVSWTTMNSPAPASSTQHYGWVIDGTTSYHQLFGSSGASRIVKVTNIDTGSQTATELVSNAAWTAASGGGSIASFFGFSQSGGFLQFTDTGTDAVWHVSKATGVVGAYVTKAQIQTYTGAANVSLLSPTKATPTGEQAFFEGTSTSILQTTGPGALTTLVSSAQLSALQGNTSVSGGLGFDGAGDLFWGSNTSHAVYKRDAGGALSQALTTANIISVTGAATATFGDMEGGPDGLMYFRDATSKNVMKFSPLNPAGTLAIAITEAELLAGPGSNNVAELGFYNNTLAFNCLGTVGLYLLPEPATLALLAFGGLTVLRRRR